MVSHLIAVVNILTSELLTKASQYQDHYQSDINLDIFQSCLVLKLFIVTVNFS